MLAADVPAWMVRLGAFLFGAVWGSFFNVAIHRWPREMSVVSPPSHCPACGTPIRPWRNVPLVSWILLRGRAACCGAPIGARYFLVELASAVLAMAIVELTMVRAPQGTELGQAAVEAALYFAFAGGLLVATFVDLEHMEIPDEVSIPGAALGLATVSFRSAPGAADAALGAGAGYLFVQLLTVWAWERMTGRRGMGEGDAKLLMMIGAFVGWQGALFALVAGAFQGLVVAVAAIATGRSLVPAPSGDLAAAHEGEEDREPNEEPNGEPNEEPNEERNGEPDDEPAPRHTGHIKVPFGPFLALGALEFLFFGDQVVAWYLALFV